MGVKRLFKSNETFLVFPEQVCLLFFFSTLSSEADVTLLLQFCDLAQYSLISVVTNSYPLTDNYHLAQLLSENSIHCS